MRGDGGSTPIQPISLAGDSAADPRYIFLTIDDGPTELMADILDILKETSCGATFFCIGSLLETEPGKALAARALGEGHRIGNHSYTFPHFSFPTLTYEKAVDEIDRTHDIIGKILADAGTDYTRHGKYFRFPFGYSGGKKVVTYLHGLGYTIYRWNINSFDWKCERHKATLSWVEKRCLSAKDGDIILCHDHGSAGIARRIIPAVVDYYRPRDFVFETLARYKAVRDEEGLKTKNVVF
jgi:peptidoglycan/xylan/chitin deacetylase (PgdA/CDA1 family)